MTLHTDIAQPWKGPRYERGIVAGLKVFIFGESAPRKEWDARKSPRGISEERVSEYVEHLENDGNPGRFIFFSTVDQVLIAAIEGAASVATNEQRIEFWNSVAFTNLVPGLVDGKPSAEQWSSVAAEFAGQIRALMPHLVLVFSSEGDRHIPESVRQDGSTEGSRYIDITKSEGLKCPKESKAYIFGHEDKHRTLYGNVFHPSGMLPRSGTPLSAEGWVPWVKQLVGWAGELKETGAVKVSGRVF